MAGWRCWCGRSATRRTSSVRRVAARLLDRRRAGRRPFPPCGRRAAMSRCLARTCGLAPLPPARPNLAVCPHLRITRGCRPDRPDPGEFSADSIRCPAGFWSARHGFARCLARRRCGGSWRLWRADPGVSV
ncbi:hypothetical protein J2S41_001182 [Catenuloplanes atrovinosus]|uniref:Uncharacterized protein n=1 Tax=Catenuloplanes atrovinosus TaxID=137266 RepID=A0AAE3YLI7_9ACTN|nr:hypothetical protein [Catenuloplanes atrovinosus]